jgi:hypothetical protein
MRALIFFIGDGPMLVLKVLGAIGILLTVLGLLFKVAIFSACYILANGVKKNEEKQTIRLQVMEELKKWGNQ